MADQSYLSIYAKSFNWAGFFLPKKIYIKCSALYDFCRTVDNIADSSENLNLKKKKLISFKNSFNNKQDDNPIIKNMKSGVLDQCWQSHCTNMIETYHCKICLLVTDILETISLENIIEKYYKVAEK